MNNSYANWNKFRIGDVLEKVSSPIKIKKSEYKEFGKIPIIDQGKEFVAGYIDDEIYQYNGVLPLIIFGDHTRILKFIDFPFAVGADGTKLLIPNDLFNIRYFYYVLKNVNLRNYGYQRHFKYLKDREIICPPKSVQKKISSILSNFDFLINNNKKRIEILEILIKTIFNEWFLRFKFPGFNKNIDKDLSLGFKKTTIREIAKEKRNNVNPENVDPYTPYLSLGHIPRKSIALCEWGFAKEVTSTKYRFEPFDILFGKIRPYFHKVIFAPMAGICSSDTIIINPKEKNYYSYLLCIVSSEDFVKYATLTSKGAKMPRADWKVLENYEINLPPPDLLEKFENFVSPIIMLIRIMILKNDLLKNIQNLLIKILISEEFNVRDIETRI